MFRFITDFADQAVLLPIVAAVTAVLTLRGWLRAALAWFGVIGATFGLMLALKLSLLACTPVFLPLGLLSPSGHAAAATVVAGGLAALMTGRWRVVLAVSSVVAVVIGTSRVQLGVHSISEAVLGGVIGLGAALAMVRLAGPPPERRPVRLLAMAGVIAVMLHGVRLPAEAAIWRASQGALDFVPACRVMAVLPS